MPDLSNYGQTVAQGVATGMALPTRASGLAEVIKSITNDLRTAASSRADAAQKMYEKNADMTKTLLTAKYRPKGDINQFLQTGDLSLWEAPPSEAEQLGQIQRMTGGGASGMLPQGTTMKVGNFNVPLNPPQTPERANTISALETMGTLLTDMQNMLSENPGRVVSGNVIGVNLFDRKANAIFRQYDKTAAIAAGGKQLTQTELALIASNRPTVADVGDPAAMQYKMNNLMTILQKAHDRLVRGLPGETPMGAADMLQGQSGGEVPVISPNGIPGSVPQEDLQQALAEGYRLQ
jgi:hypothetical protein